MNAAAIRLMLPADRGSCVVAGHATNDGGRTMHEVWIEDDVMYLLNEDCEGVDCHLLVGPDEAKRQIDEWAAQYPIDVEAAKRDLDDVDF